jgi:hypothetical protein
MATTKESDSTYVIAKQRLEKIKKTINAVEIPKTFAELRRQPIPAFPGRVDHGTLTDQYSVFINPRFRKFFVRRRPRSHGQVLPLSRCIHPTRSFSNSLIVWPTDQFEFVANLRWALTHEPAPVPELARQFRGKQQRTVSLKLRQSRGQAYERDRLGLSKLDERIVWLHNEVGKGATGDMIRKVLVRAPPVARFNT